MNKHHDEKQISPVCPVEKRKRSETRRVINNETDQITISANQVQSANGGNMEQLQEITFALILALQQLSPALDDVMGFFTFLGKIEFYLLIIPLI